MEPIKVTSKTHIMISGGAGFIGSHLSRRLLKSGAHVTILTRHPRSPRAMQLAQEGAVVIPYDFSSPDRAPIADSLRTVDVFYHLAADVSVSSPALWTTNVAGTLHACDLASSLNVPYMVLASSIEAQGLGANDEIPLCEEGACRPVSEYGISKVKAEDIVTRWAQASGRQALILRIGNIYGPGSAWLLHSSLMALMGLSPLSVAWSELQHRVFQPLYVDDLVDGMLSAAGQRLTGLYNITGEEPVTVASYLHTLASLVQLPDRGSLMQASSATAGCPTQDLAPDFAYLLMGTPDRCHRSYDNTKLRSCIGSYGRWSLARGMASTLQWYRQSDIWPSFLQVAQMKAKEAICTSH